ncbi:MAG: energy-coupled thiamine transporter ThiT [Bacillota bacterium]
MEQKRSKVLMLTEGGMMIALSALLSYIRIYQAPNGGSVTAGSMIPIMIFAIRWGLLPGVAVGATYGMLDFILKPYFVHPLQLLLDYPLAFGSLGLAGIAYYLTKKKKSSGYGPVILGVTIAITGRLVAHVLSGVVFFAEYAGDQNPWIYSIIYNATYLVPELIISLVVLVIVWKPIQKFIK